MIYLKDTKGYITLCRSEGNFATTASKFAIGCQLIDSTTGTSYINTGTVAAPAWTSQIGMAAWVDLTAAQIAGMYATPVQLVAPVAGKAIIVDSAEVVVKGTVTQFASGGAVAIQYDSTVHGAGTAATATIAAAVVNNATANVYTRRIPVDLSAIASASIINIGLYISNASGAFTTGNGTATVTIRYHLVS